MLLATVRDIVQITKRPAGDYLGDLRPGIAFPDLAFSDGVGSNQANLFLPIAGKAIANGVTDNVDLRSFTGFNPAGALVPALSMVEVRTIWFRPIGAALTIRRAAATGWNGFGAAWTMTCPAGLWVRFINQTDGLLPTTAGDKNIEINNASGLAATYDLLIMGVNA